MIKLLSQDGKCILCGAEGLVDAGRSLIDISVTSDCKPWPKSYQLNVCGCCGHIQKKVDSEWLADIEAIYSNYEMFSISGGLEQSVFADFTAIPKSKRLFEQVMKAFSVREIGSFLDFGCGTGPGILSFGALFPKWRLYGYDQVGMAAESVLKIPGVHGFYSGDIESISERFDMICMTQVIEHLVNPLKIVKRLLGLLKPGGYMVIQTQNLEKNPFDILIADHCSHFTLGTLKATLIVAGFTVTLSSDEWIAKELSFVATPAEIRDEALFDCPSISDSIACIKKNLAWLGLVGESANKIAGSGTFGVFGTAIAATWIAAVVGGAVGFFVDEDEARSGKTHMGKPVFHPKDAPKGAVVYLAFSYEVAVSVQKRLDERYSQINFALPPSF